MSKELQFTHNYDDSSDEESTNSRTKKDDILIKAKEVGKQFKNPNLTEKQIKGSFLLQSLGVEMLYSQPVNELYYGKKEQILSEPINFDEQKKLVKEQLIEGVSQFFYRGLKKEYPELFVIYQDDLRFVEAFLEANPTILDEVVDEMFKDESCARQTMRCAIDRKFDKHPSYLDGGKLKELEERLLYFSKERLELQNHSNFVRADTEIQKKIEVVNEGLREDLMINDIDGPARSFTQNNFGENVRDCVEGAINQYNDGSDVDESYYEDDEDDDGLFYYMDDNDDIKAQLQEAIWYDVQSATGNPENLSDQDRITIATFKSKAEESRLSEDVVDYAKLSAKQNNSSSFLAVVNDSLSRIERVFLSANHQFQSADAVDFLSNLRISNRSQKRHARQLADYVKNGEITRLGQQESFRSWSFKDVRHQALETQSVTTKGKRVDLVSNLGTYELVYKCIDNLKSKLNCDDKFIAEQFRNVVSGKGISKQITNPFLRETFTSLTYVLFGTETTRNPGQLVAIQIALDLVIEGKSDWKSMLNNESMKLPKTTKNGVAKLESNGGDIPMTMGGAVAAMRYLYDKYPDQLPFPYRYDNDDPNSYTQSERNAGEKLAIDLIKRESSIINKWIRLKKEKGELKENFSAQDLIDLVRNQQVKWYGIQFFKKNPTANQEELTSRPPSPKPSPQAKQSRLIADNPVSTFSL